VVKGDGRTEGGGGWDRGGVGWGDGGGGMERGEGGRAERGGWKRGRLRKRGREWRVVIRMREVCVGGGKGGGRWEGDRRT